MAFFHTSVAQRARVLMSRLRDILMFLRGHFFRAGGREPFWRAGVALFLPHPPPVEKSEASEADSRHPPKGELYGFSAGVRSKVSSPRTKKVSDTRTTSCSESAHVLCVRVLHSRQVEHMVPMWKKMDETCGY